MCYRFPIGKGVTIMKLIAATAAAFGLVAALATPVLAQDMTANIKARQGQFRILALNLGVLGGMAKGELTYDAAGAQAAADSIVGVSMVHQPTLFVEGTDDMSVEGTRALPAIWENPDDFAAKWAALGEAAKGMQAAAGTSAEAIGAAMGPLGGACKSCHETYRTP